MRYVLHIRLTYILCATQIHRCAVPHCLLLRLQFMLPPPLYPDFPLAAAANSHKCHVRQFVICVKDAAANASHAALESCLGAAREGQGVATRYPVAWAGRATSCKSRACAVFKSNKSCNYFYRICWGTANTSVLVTGYARDGNRDTYTRCASLRRVNNAYALWCRKLFKQFSIGGMQRTGD